MCDLKALPPTFGTGSDLVTAPASLSLRQRKKQSCRKGRELPARGQREAAWSLIHRV